MQSQVSGQRDLLLHIPEHSGGHPAGKLLCRIAEFIFLKKIHRYGDEDALDSLKGSVTGQDHYKDTVIGISRKKNQLIYKTSMKTSHSSFPHKTKLSIRGYKKEKKYYS